MIEAVTTAIDIFKDGDPTGVRVEYRDEDSWAVLTRGRGCLSNKGKWDFEPLPSSRTDAWKAKHRFTKDEAIRLALEVVE